VHIEVPEGVRQRGTIIAYHGFMSYSVYNIPGLYRIAEQGWVVIAVDLPGHGFSTGLSGSIQDFKDYAEVSAAVRSWAMESGLETDGPWLVLGHSAGGAAAVESLLDSRGLFDGGILLAPLVRPRTFALTKSVAFVLSPFVVSIPPRGYEEGFLGAPFIPMSWIRALGTWSRRLRRPGATAGLPVLCLWGAGEDALNVNYSARVLDRLFPGMQTQVLPGVGHIVFDLGPGQELAIMKILEFLGSTYQDSAIVMNHPEIGSLGHDSR
jgi:alpha-beta hydrolase superfamily lysophospholipase